MNKSTNDTSIKQGYFKTHLNFKLDASSETLLIEGDPDLKYLNEITKRYGAREFLVLTYTPLEDMISPNSIKKLVDENYEAVWTISKTDKKYHPYKALIIKKNKSLVGRGVFKIVYFETLGIGLVW